MSLNNSRRNFIMSTAGIVLLSSKRRANAGTAPAGSLDVKLSVDFMECIVPTEAGLLNNRDEVFIEVKGNVQPGDGYARLPGEENYYEFSKGSRRSENGWTDRDGIACGRPVLFCGKLEQGERAELLIKVREQDNDDVHVSASSDRRRQFDSFLGSPVWNQQELHSALSLLEDWIWRERDYISAFSVTISNNGGTVATEWRPIIFTSISAKGTTPESPEHYALLTKLNAPGLASEILRMSKRSTKTNEIELTAKGTNGCHYTAVMSVTATASTQRKQGSPFQLTTISVSPC